jgi:hypothetical protein
MSISLENDLLAVFHLREDWLAADNLACRGIDRHQAIRTLEVLGVG